MAKILLVDGYSLLFRGFHALPLLTSDDGTFTNAIHGFFSMLVKALDEYRPDYLAVMLDVHAPTFRHTMYADYKGTRKPMPEELRPQTTLLRKLLEAMHICVCEMEGYEADDLLGTASRMANEQGIDAYVLTGDRDSLQLVGGGTQIILTKKGITESLLLDSEGVLANFGFTPAQVPDMKGLMGDSSDNIPGIAGVGEKTALKLMSEYGSLDAILEHADEIKGKLGEKIRTGMEDALLSRELGRICRTAPMEIDFSSCTWDHITDAAPMLEQYGLVTLLRNMRALTGGEAATPEVRATGAAKRAAGTTGTAPQTASAMAVEPESTMPKPEKPRNEKTFNDASVLRQAADALLASQPEFVCICMTTAEITLYSSEKELWHMPLTVDLLGMGLYEDAVFAALQDMMAEIPVTVHGSKSMLGMFSRFGIKAPKIGMDTMLAAYLLHTAQKDYGLPATLAAEFGETPKEYNAFTVYELSLRQKTRLEARGMTKLLWDMEQPLAEVLYGMETEGFLVDRSMLTQLGEFFTGEIESCKEAVYRESGVRDFNLNSPKQLGEVLFEKLGLPAPQKKGKTGYSTSAEVLEELSPYHPCIEPLLRFRKISKLQSTYIEGLQKMCGNDGRVHTTFDQTATVTGRISSQEPNLQNIPIRTDEGREIRRAFVAVPGKVLLDADYSQIELRVLAHMSGDEAMCDAFIKGQDIHTRTAAEIRGVPMDEVTPEMRRAAKATNFGIVYGISAFGLARNAHISRS